MPFDLLARKATHFVLWRPTASTTAPVLLIGQFQAGVPPTLVASTRFTMSRAAGVTGLWEKSAAACGLVDGRVYHYWFEVQSTHPGRSGATILCTDPTAWAVEWSLIPPPLAAPFTDEDRQPAAVVLFAGGQLRPSDFGGEQPTIDGDPKADTLPANNQMVIYELPTAWARTAPGSLGIATGTFQDVRSLVDAGAAGKTMSDLSVTRIGNAHLVSLGINALELLPPADSFFKREWGYDTAHFLAPDSQLGQPEGNSWSTANRDLSDLVGACHREKIRVIVDMVMAFSRNEAYQHIAFDEFCIDDAKHHLDDPDALTSRSTPGHPQVRDGFGSTLFRYTRPLASSFYDPEWGVDQPGLVPARQHMYTQLTRWMTDFRIDGVRMDSVENVANWDFVGSFKDHARALFSARWAAQGLGGGADAHFLVVGEELNVPLDLLTQKRLDGLWNDHFRVLVRAAVFGLAAGELDGTFEGTVRKAIDCRSLGFADGAQAVNYITSHDVQDPGRERLFTSFTKFNGFSAEDAIRRIKLAHVCLLTAVGIPMILAGEEFADLHTRFDVNGKVSQEGGKQVAPVHFDLLDDVFVSDAASQAAQDLVLLRRDLLGYVSRLVHLRTSCLALSLNDTAFLHVDLNDGKRVLVWQRGPGADGSLIIVIANFSEFSTDTSAGSTAEYVVPNWPAGRKWREITQGRDVPAAFAGKEPIFAWEAKVYLSST